MNATLNALGPILIQALPTFFLVLLLHIYLKAVFFTPLARVLAKRAEATEGARRQAAESLSRAEAKANAYEESLRAARNEIYKEQEDIRRKWQEEQAAQLLLAREQSQTLIQDARRQIAAEAENAKRSLEANTVVLAEDITRAILAGRRA